MRFLPLLLCFFAISSSSLAEETKLRALFLGDRGHHQPSARFQELQPALAKRGIDLTYTEDLAQLTLENLKRYDALVVYANIDEIAADQAQGLLDYVSQGGGFVPLHCASYCFRNRPEIVALMGAQFKSHGTGVFRTEIADAEHPLMAGFAGFESWDETYVHHLHNDKQRTVLEYRADEKGREPWTWIREHGQGRVFYTAWGHDRRTWTNPGFVNLVERGIRYVSRQDPKLAGPFQEQKPFPVPEMTALRKDLAPFEYIDVGKEIPNYPASAKWGTQDEPLSMMQKPLPPEESIKHFVTPKNFRVELFVSEPDLKGKPIAMTWDERGRLWVVETYDYPNELQPAGQGRDSIRICEDTDGDWKADKFTVFAKNLSIPTSIAFHKGGVLVQNGPETIYLKDTNGDDQADERQTVFTGWALNDTHGGVSNFQYGLDNYIWAMQGYNNSEPVGTSSGAKQSFRMGFFRMKPDGSEIEFLRSTNNNTWGLGLSEEGLVFGSTANGNPSVFMPIPNRYYERVKGWSPSLTLSSIADTNAFHPITDKVRQVDNHGGYTAGAGHAVYTAREYPPEYWNRVAFVNGPTGHLVGSFILKPDGSGFKSTSPFNLLASDDEWSAPIMAEVGPDGNVWVIDWYNYIVQHNPTPKGFENGKGNAYETKLRDKKHGRIYRVVYNDSKETPMPDLAKSTPLQWVANLKHPVMMVRMHAQRLIVEQGDDQLTDDLIALVNDQRIDSIGLNVAAIHALWALHGLGLLDGKHPHVTAAVVAALQHPSAGVRRNAIQVLPPTVESVSSLLAARLHHDANMNTRLAAILALADLPATDASGEAVMEMLQTALVDPWIPDAATSAAAHNSVPFLQAWARSKAPVSPEIAPTIELVAGHYARSGDFSAIANLVAILKDADPSLIRSVIAGLGSNWQNDSTVTLTADLEANMAAMVDRIGVGDAGPLVKLASRWGSKKFSELYSEITKGMIARLNDESQSDQVRGAAAVELVEFLPGDEGVIDALLDAINVRTSPQLALKLLSALEQSRSETLGSKLVARLKSMTPGTKGAALSLLLKRPQSTIFLLDSAQKGDISINELSLDQRQSVATHPDRRIRDRATKLLASGGTLPNADRQRVVEEAMVSARKKGDVGLGKEVFKTHCSKCHTHNGEGFAVGPDLTGMAVHPKEELLIHILDPNRSVEGNFRVYTVVTSDGLVLSGMLASESKTSIELFDNEGKKRAVLREDIDELVASKQSVMPEGFEKSIKPDEFVNLLEFLTARGKYVPVDIGKAATVASDRGMFIEASGTVERLIFPDWSPKTVKGVPFMLINPRDGSVKNAIELYGPNGTMSRSMPRQTSVRIGGPAKAIHMLSGVSGWGHPYGGNKAIAMIVRFKYTDGTSEDHELLNGVHFADYIRRVDVPESEFAFDLQGRQIRYLAVQPRKPLAIETMELVKGPDDSAPVVMAVTAESP